MFLTSACGSQSGLSFLRDVYYFKIYHIILWRHSQSGLSFLRDVYYFKIYHIILWRQFRGYRLM